MVARLQSEALGWRWCKPSTHHITVAFLGDVPSERLPELISGVQEVVARTLPFVPNYAGVGCFPSAQRPRVLWAGVGVGGDAATALHEELRKSLFADGFHVDGRFEPHLTIARSPKFGRGPENAVELLARHSSWSTPEAPLKGVVVMGSVLGLSGPTYTVLGNATFE